MASVTAHVKPELLIWARKSAGFSIDEAAKKLQVKPDRVQQWEEGIQSPTIIQLKNMGHVYKRPLSVFYLPNAPKDFRVMHDFRRLPGKIAGQYTPMLRMASRIAQQRRQLALELWGILGEEPPTFSLNASLDIDPEDIGRRIRKNINVSFSEQSSWRDAYAGFNNWRAKLESVGMLIFQAREIERSEMRGFSIAQSKLPVIMVNAEDSYNGRIFSLFHECVHIMLHESGLCDFEEDYNRPPEEQTVEVFCNRVAAATLIPKTRLLTEPIVKHQKTKDSWTDEELNQLAKVYCVSREVILRRLLTLGQTTNSFYMKKRVQFLEEYESYQKRAKVKARKNPGGPSPSVMTISNYGKEYVRLVLNSYHQERITLSDVSDYLSVRVKHLPNIEAAVRTT